MNKERRPQLLPLQLLENFISLINKMKFEYSKILFKTNAKDVYMT